MMVLPGSPYPLELSLDAPERIARWRPLVHWLLVIPHLVVLYLLTIVQRIVLIISFFAILFTGAMPPSLFDFNAMVLRYHWRVASYSMFMRSSYPEFDFNMVAAESVELDADPAMLAVQPSERLSRGLIFVKWLLAIPHYIVLFFLFIAVFVLMIVGFFAVLITGSWPVGMRDFIIGVTRWSAHVNMYILLMTDKYPPFSLS